MPHASFNASMVPYLASHHVRNAAGVVGVVVAVVPAVFVAHVPGGHIRVVLVAFGKFAAQAQRVFLEHPGLWAADWREPALTV